jgi:hypothetical protein
MASKYWLLVKIDSFGKCRTQEVEEAKAFLCQQFLNSLTEKTYHIGNSNANSCSGSTTMTLTARWLKFVCAALSLTKLRNFAGN